MSPQSHPPPVPTGTASEGLPPCSHGGRRETAGSHIAGGPSTPTPVPEPGPAPSLTPASLPPVADQGRAGAPGSPAPKTRADPWQAASAIVLRLLAASLVAALLSHLATQAGPPPYVGRILHWVVLATGGTAVTALAVLVFLTPTIATVPVANILLWLGLPLLRDHAMLLAQVGEAAPALKDWITTFVEPGPKGQHPAGLAILQGAFLVYSVACLVCFNPPFADKRMEEPARFPR